MLHFTQTKRTIKITALPALLLLLCVPTYAHAQEHAQTQDKTQTLEYNLQKQVKNHKDDKFITLAVENDLFGGGTDRNYTNGIRLSYFDVNAAFPEFAHHIANQVPTFSINDTSSVFYSIGQNLYTPDDIKHREQQPDDRPWAAFLYSSIGMATVTNNHIDELEATIGIVGPLALGEQVQKAVHKHLSDSPTPKGWSNQLKNEPGLILSWQRRWPQTVSYETAGLTFSATPYIGASLGNIYTYANTGLNLRISPAQWSDTPQRVRPSIPGTGYFETPENGWDWYVFGGVEGRAVAQNIFLDGNTFTDSHSVDKKIFVRDSNIGLAFTYGRTRLSYTLVHRTKAFKTQENADLFGAVSVAYKF